jgi:hypothetical protein
VSLAAVIASMFWPWTARGSGSAIPAHRFAALLLEGRVDFAVPRWVGAVLFLVPVCAATAVAMLTVGGRAAYFARNAAAVICLAICVTALVVLHSLSVARMGIGGWLALCGATLGAAFVVMGTKERVQ